MSMTDEEIAALRRRGDWDDDECDRVLDEVAALREENARLVDGIGRWRTFCSMAEHERDQLRARVAALVREVKLSLAGNEAAKLSLIMLLSEPDLAALVTEQEARERVVEAAIAWGEASDSTFPFAEMRLRDALTTLAALDALRGEHA